MYYVMVAVKYSSYIDEIRTEISKWKESRYFTFIWRHNTNVITI